jgi:uncharacterized DUF497 family protein
MQIEIVFVPAAFKHGISAENIRWALENYLIYGIIAEENDKTKYLAIGFDKYGRLLEVMYNYIDEQTVTVFHAMRCRRQFYDRWEVQEKLWQI